MIRHIVMWKFKDGEQEKAEQFLIGLKNLMGEIPELKSMEVGINIANNNNCDAVLIADFDSLEDLEKYKINPKHVKVSELCKSIRVQRNSVDFEI